MSASDQLVAIAKARFDPVTAKHVSFLFGEKDAESHMDRDSLFQLGFTGFQELLKLDARFAPFEKIFFSIAAKEFNRTQQTRGESAHLDASLRVFLPLLSGHLVQSGAQKVLEYLIGAFQVHIYNVGEVLACFMPYHETELFPRILKVLNLQSWPQFAPFKKQNIPMPKQSLIDGCMKDERLMQFVFTIMKRAISTQCMFPSTVSFFTTVLAGVMQTPTGITENFIRTALPSFLDIAACPFADAQQAALTLVMLLVHRAALTPAVVATSMRQLAQAASDALVGPFLGTLSFLWNVGHPRDPAEDEAAARMPVMEDAVVVALMKLGWKDAGVRLRLEQLVARCPLEAHAALLTEALLANLPAADLAAEPEAEEAADSLPAHARRLLELLAKHHGKALDRGLAMYLRSETVRLAAPRPAGRGCPVRALLERVFADTTHRLVALTPPPPLPPRALRPPNPQVSQLRTDWLPCCP
ncbi:putative ARM repeat superfamily protein [Paratrimastix pyriformis]|uniref:HEAT repeat-containing protein 1 n=1 Tax=Paratrimastix pyriformis TaxID=342808 RepID=A0ABQ8UVW5_9EUKA|nr:putative ARM repeat superfamily protein [Paratrimastix pyriformis]